MGKSLILGFFDGVHTAHQSVIRSAVEYSKDTLLITFKDSPARYFNQNVEYIFTREESVKKIKALGVKEILELDFSKIASMPADEYLKYLVSEFSPVSISTGFNHTFGRDKTGTPEFLELNQKKYGYKYFCIPAQKVDGQIISSTLIRQLLKDGKIEDANQLLGSRFILSGCVIKGAQLGRTIGFPTANIKYPKDIIKIPYGVYAVFADGRPSVLNWGMKPTVNNTIEPVVETHIINFEGNLYGKTLRIEFLKRIRGEQKFGSLSELKEQIKKDIKECLKL